jgi:hypothetical protein
MALTLEAIANVKRRCLAEAKGVGTQAALRMLFEVLNDKHKNPDLKIAFFSTLTSADKVVSDSPCKVFAVFGKKPAASTTDAWLKGSDHATVAAANGDFVAKFVGTGGGGKEHCVTFPDGLPMATGFTLGCHTTVNGNTKSATADDVTGFAIVGAP